MSLRLAAPSFRLTFAAQEPSVSAYFIVRAEILDPEAYQAYASRSPTVIAAFGGRHIAHGGRATTFEDNQFHLFLRLQHRPPIVATLVPVRSMASDELNSPSDNINNTYESVNENTA